MNTAENKEKKNNIIAIGYAKGFLKKNTQERQRAQRYAARLASYHVIVFTRKSEGFEKIHEGNFTVHPTNSKNRLSMLFDAYSIGKDVVKQHKDTHYIVTCQDPFETSLVGLFLSRARNAIQHVQIHGDFFSKNTWRKESPLNIIRYWFGRFVIARTPCIRVVSERIRDSIVKKGVDKRRITVLPIAPLLNEFLDTYHKRASKGDAEAITILTAGRLAHEKNIGLIIRAFGALVKKYPALSLRIVGEGPQEHELRSLTRSLGVDKRVAFVSWVPSLVSELAQADIFALSSDHEGYALVLVEAMASGVPVVTTNVGCVGEVLLDEVHGHVVPPKDESAFTRALEDLLEHPEKQERFGKNAVEAARKLAQKSEKDYAEAWVASFSHCLKEV